MNTKNPRPNREDSPGAYDVGFGIILICVALLLYFGISDVAMAILLAALGGLSILVGSSKASGK